MKKILYTLIASLLLTGCGVGSYSVSSGKADEGTISFTATRAADITVTIDGNSYNIMSIKDSAYKPDRRIKQTARNTIIVSPGSHDVKVEMNGKTVFSKKLFISASEHKIVEL
ncbi:MAG: hypothetical protein ACI4TM_05095 [Candidatus Cryptobacteroides sp.]